MPARIQARLLRLERQYRQHFDHLRGIAVQEFARRWPRDLWALSRAIKKSIAHEEGGPLPCYTEQEKSAYDHMGEIWDSLVLGLPLPPIPPMAFAPHYAYGLGSDPDLDDFDEAALYSNDWESDELPPSP